MKTRTDQPHFSANEMSCAQPVTTAVAKTARRNTPVACVNELSARNRYLMPFPARNERIATRLSCAVSSSARRCRPRPISSAPSIRFILASTAATFDRLRVAPQNARAPQQPAQQYRRAQQQPHLEDSRDCERAGPSTPLQPPKCDGS